MRQQLQDGLEGRLKDLGAKPQAQPQAQGGADEKLREILPKVFCLRQCLVPPRMKACEPC